MATRGPSAINCCHEMVDSCVVFYLLYAQMLTECTAHKRTKQSKTNFVILKNEFR